MIGALVSPDTPGDASHAIGEGDGGDVMAPCLGSAEDPGLKRVRLTSAMGCQESGACTVNEEHPEVAVASLGDGPETPGGSRGGFSGGEAEVVGKATA